MQETRKKHPLVFISWTERENPDLIHALAWHQGRGPVRVYERDQLSPKMPYLATAEEALLWMEEQPGEQIQVDRRVAAELGFEEPIFSKLRVA